MLRFVLVAGLLTVSVISVPSLAYSQSTGDTPAAGAPLTSSLATTPTVAETALSQPATSPAPSSAPPAADATDEPAEEESQMAVDKNARMSDLVDSCAVSGTVLKASRIFDTPWPGVPASLGEYFTEVTLAVQTSRLHESHTGLTPSRCDAYKPGMRQIYKLCSLTKVKAGDLIKGVDGGSSRAKRICLFDVDHVRTPVSQKQPAETAPAVPSN